MSFYRVVSRPSTLLLAGPSRGLLVITSKRPCPLLFKGLPLFSIHDHTPSPDLCCTSGPYFLLHYSPVRVRVHDLLLIAVHMNVLLFDRRSSPVLLYAHTCERKVACMYVLRPYNVGREMSARGRVLNTLSLSLMMPAGDRRTGAPYTTNNRLQQLIVLAVNYSC